MLRLLLEFDKAGIAILRQFIIFNRGSDSTTRLMFVAAISISTISGNPNKFFETHIDPVAGTYDTQFSHTRCVNQHCTLIENNELPA